MRWVLLCMLSACQYVFSLDGPVDAVVADSPQACWDPGATGDHDNDNLVDGCDPCPAIPDAAPVADADLDLVSDVCDPEPQAAGERIIAFDGLETATAWQEINGMWSVGNGGYTQSDGAAKSETTRGVPPSLQPTLDVQYTIAQSPTTSSSSVFVVVASGDRVQCRKRFGNGSDFLELLISGQVVDMSEIANNSEIVRLTLWQTGDGAFHCRVRQGGIDVTADGPPGAIATFNKVGLALDQTVATFDAVTVLATE
jgi:hypothetical protein